MWRSFLPISPFNTESELLANCRTRKTPTHFNYTRVRLIVCMRASLPATGEAFMATFMYATRYCIFFDQERNLSLSLIGYEPTKAGHFGNLHGMSGMEWCVHKLWLCYVYCPYATGCYYCGAVLEACTQDLQKFCGASTWVCVYSNGFCGVNIMQCYTRMWLLLSCLQARSGYYRNCKFHRIIKVSNLIDSTLLMCCMYICDWLSCI